MRVDIFSPYFRLADFFTENPTNDVPLNISWKGQPLLKEMIETVITSCKMR